MFECHTDTIYTIQNEGWGGSSKIFLPWSTWLQVPLNHGSMVPHAPDMFLGQGSLSPHVPPSQYSTLFRGRVVGSYDGCLGWKPKFPKHAKLEKSFAELSQQVSDANDTCWFLGCFCRGCGWPPIHLTSFLHLGCLVFVVETHPLGHGQDFHCWCPWIRF